MDQSNNRNSSQIKFTIPILNKLWSDNYILIISSSLLQPTIELIDKQKLPRTRSI